MRAKLTVDIMGPNEAIEGLEIGNDPTIRVAEERAEQARQNAAKAARRVEEAEALFAALKLDVVDGRRPESALVDAIRQRDAAAMLAPEFAARVPVAEAAIGAARAKVVAERLALAESRRDMLQREINKLVPLLEATRDVELALDQAARKLGQAGGVTALRWPQSLVDECGGGAPAPMLPVARESFTTT